MARGAIGQANIAFDSVQLEDEANSVTMTFDVPPANVTAFADVYQVSVAGKPSAKLDIQGAWDPAAAQGDATIFAELGGVAKAYDFEPGGGETTGYDGFAIVTSYSITATVTDAVKWAGSLLHNGGSAAMDGLAPTRA